MKNLGSAVAALFMTFAAFGLTGGAAQAALMSQDLAESAGADTFVTFDTATGLQWLDLNLTTDISYNGITGGTDLSSGALAGDNPISDYGFRHATAAEVETLFTNAGIALFETVDPGIFAAVDSLITLLSATFDAGIFRVTAGLTSTASGTPGENIAPNLLTCFGSTDTDDCVNLTTGANDLGFAGLTGTLSVDSAQLDYGHWLVRSTAIPEPGTLGLLGLGLLGLGLARRGRAA